MACFGGTKYVSMWAELEAHVRIVRRVWYYVYLKKIDGVKLKKSPAIALRRRRNRIINIDLPNKRVAKK